MEDLHPLEKMTEDIRALMCRKLGVRGRDFADVSARAERQLPGALKGHCRELAQALSRVHHPKLRQTLDMGALEQAGDALSAHLDAIDPADRRWGYLLGVLGTIAFNLLLLSAIVICVLVWRGVV